MSIIGTVFTPHKKYYIQRLSFFGSFLRDDFNEQSDIDVLVEFEPEHVPGFDFFMIEIELSQLLGKKVSLQTPNFLSPEFRHEVISKAFSAYEQP